MTFVGSEPLAAFAKGQDVFAYQNTTRPTALDAGEVLEMPPVACGFPLSQHGSLYTFDSNVYTAWISGRRYDGSSHDGRTLDTTRRRSERPRRRHGVRSGPSPSLHRGAGGLVRGEAVRVAR